MSTSALYALARSSKTTQSFKGFSVAALMVVLALPDFWSGFLRLHALFMS
jgi:hypothetical protein